MDIFTIIIILIAALILIRFLKKPIKFIFKMLINAVIGFIVLFVLNTIGLDVELSLLNALITGIFGLPGVILLLLLRYVL